MYKQKYHVNRFSNKQTLKYSLNIYFIVTIRAWKIKSLRKNIYLRRVTHTDVEPL